MSVEILRQISRDHVGAASNIAFAGTTARCFLGQLQGTRENLECKIHYNCWFVSDKKNKVELYTCITLGLSVQQGEITTPHVERYLIRREIKRNC